MDVVANIEISSVWLADKWGNRTSPCTILFKLGRLLEGLEVRYTNLTAFRCRSARGRCSDLKSENRPTLTLRISEPDVVIASQKNHVFR